MIMAVVEHLGVGACHVTPFVRFALVTALTLRTSPMVWAEKVDVGVGEDMEAGAGEDTKLVEGMSALGDGTVNEQVIT